MKYAQICACSGMYIEIRGEYKIQGHNEKYDQHPLIQSCFASRHRQHISIHAIGSGEIPRSEPIDVENPLVNEFRRFANRIGARMAEGTNTMPVISRRGVLEDRTVVYSKLVYAI